MNKYREHRSWCGLHDVFILTSCTGTGLCNKRVYLILIKTHLSSISLKSQVKSHHTRNKHFVFVQPDGRLQ